MATEKIKTAPRSVTGQMVLDHLNAGVSQLDIMLRFDVTQSYVRYVNHKYGARK